MSEMPCCSVVFLTAERLHVLIIKCKLDTCVLAERPSFAGSLEGLNFSGM